MNKTEMDIQLIEASLLEKWFPLQLGTFEPMMQSAIGSCVLCQVYYLPLCIGCPVNRRTGRMNCKGTPHELYTAAIPGSCEEAQAIDDECEFLISLLPENHPWRNI